MLEFPPGIDISSNGSFHSISGMKILIDIYNKIEDYLKEHGEKQERPCRHPVYYLREGIPNS